MRTLFIHYLLVAIALLERLVHRLQPAYKPNVEWTGFRKSMMQNCIIVGPLKPVQMGKAPELMK
jgi:hypothetical protein